MHECDFRLLGARGTVQVIERYKKLQPVTEFARVKNSSVKKFVRTFVNGVVITTAATYALILI